MFLKYLRQYFGFSQKELNGVLVLIFLLLLVWLLPCFLNDRPTRFDIDKAKKEIAQFERTVVPDKVYSYREVKLKPGSREESVYADFDPNGLSVDRWKQLGLSEKQIAVIKHFEARGGHFYKKEDVQKMYVISPKTYASLEPFIKIAPIVRVKNTFVKSPKVRIELNTADSLALEQVSGIGPAFASRILKYRERLGGFYSLEQLKEVYGVDSAHFVQWMPQLQLNTGLLRKININTASFEEFKRHPYLSYKQINALLQYRKQHGAYATLADLKNIPLFTDEILRKLAPYLICK
ncbi:MAG: helix-hairpin-helix domain-containing protein [Sphingobacteriaceae bacterium]